MEQELEYHYLSVVAITIVKIALTKKLGISIMESYLRKNKLKKF